MTRTHDEDTWPHWAGDPLIRHHRHAPRRELDFVASARAGHDINRATCACGGMDAVLVTTPAELVAAYDTHMRSVQRFKRTR
ncbi:hypothetical protein GCM10010466_39370 [Planomonospora alba]|uniref:Uncharacterized protein n=1 Tax=Planomonospora alba TaxID=161354 RepID=A0ABP6NF26_9ACTN